MRARLQRILAGVKSRLRLANQAMQSGAGAGESHDQELLYLQQKVTYLENQLHYMNVLVRHLAAPVMEELPFVRQTKASFDFQWANIPQGRYMLENPEFRKEAAGYVQQFSGLPASWFPGKKVIDVGCGLGRYSWAMCTMGAEVLSVDQSAAGLKRVTEACKDYPTHRTRQVDLLRPLDIAEQFDLVWCFGVLHHTGDTYGAFKRIAPLVKPGGHIFLMLYGLPRPEFVSDYAEINEYDAWRRRTCNKDLAGKLDAVVQGMRNKEFRVPGEEHIHGYFDAVAPPINDLYSFEEVEGWLLEEGFADIRITVPTRNLHLVARRP